MKTFNFFILLILLTSCLKTAEQIEREKGQIVREETEQKMMADITVRTKNLEEQVSRIQGSFEEIQRNNTQGAFQKDSVDELRVQVEEQQRKIKNLEKELSQQKKFIKQVTKTLSRLSKVLNVKN